MPTHHRVIIGNSQIMPEIESGSVELMVTSPPYPMIAMWDEQFKSDLKISELWQKLDVRGDEATVRQIYNAMHDSLAKVWVETYRVLCDGGIACINIGDATRSIAGKIQLFPNRPRITEICEKIGFTTLALHSVEKTHQQAKLQGQRRLFRVRFPSPKRLCHLGLRVYPAFQKG